MTPYASIADRGPLARGASEEADEPKPVQRLAVVGLGLMGLGIAQAAAAAGLRVALIARDAQSALAGSRRLAAQIERQISRGRISAAAGTALLANVAPSPDDHSLADCDIAIESVDEDRDVKTEVLRRIEAATPAGALIAANTSGLAIAGLAAALRHPERFIGLHFFSPAERMALVEVVRGEATALSTQRAALAFVDRLGKRPIAVRDGPGFFTSRVFAAYLDEALAMVGEGVAPVSIEDAAIAGGRAIGPLATLDEVSLRLNFQQGLQARADGLDERFRRSLAMPILARMIEIGRGGRRLGGGFYDYPSAGAKELWSGLTQAFKPAARPPPVETIRLRLRCAEAMEALRCLEEGVIFSADDADVASTLGLGFPKNTGGVLRWVESMGVDKFVAACDELAGACGPRFEPSAWLREAARRGQALTAWRAREPPGSCE
jgi:3-hydroxyacyl-CoA dehydrogenase/enoyl-CoA hydratase/3-hydroxybutyryl-CoA epimerase